MLRACVRTVSTPICRARAICALERPSRVLQEFDGGPGQIALHGTNQLAGALGTAVSHGCIRLSTRAIAWLARRIGAGVPLTVTR
jgi:lipoprotein-anchoring transpeptidase ErfK/SrfK